MIEQSEVSRCFDRGSESYDELAKIQREVAEQLFLKVAPVMRQARSVVDLGCGTGRLLADCRSLNSAANLTGVDCAPAMLSIARSRVSDGRWLKASLDRVPLQGASQCVVVSTSAIQWVPVEGALEEASRLTKVGGVVAISSYLDETLLDWRKLWNADRLAMPNKERVLSAALKAGLAIRSVDTEWRTQWCESFDVAVSSVRDLGAGANNRSSKGLLGRREYLSIKKHVNAIINKLGGFPMRYHVIYLVAEKQGEVEV